MYGSSFICLDKNVPVPLYYQLKKQVLAMIDAGTLKEGDMLPPENELCDLLRVSRPTVRQALGRLVAEGYLNRFKGKGTFVSRPKVEERFFSKLETFHNEMTAKGLTPRTEVICLKKLAGPHEANEQLHIPLDADLVCLGRLRSVDNVSLVYVETFLPYRQYEKMMEVDFTVHSLYDSLEKIYHVRINRVRREIVAINARKKEADLLCIARNKAVNLVKTVAVSDSSPYPVEFSLAWYRGDLNKFSLDVFR
jgi:GntR family transcriptional regulator